MKRLGILVSGRGSNMLALIRASAAQRLSAEVRIVISNNRDSAALASARAHNITVAHLSGRTHPEPRALDRAMRDTLLAQQVDFVLLAGFMKKIGPATLAAFKRRILNIHPALLPEFGGRGMHGPHVHEAVLAAGKTETGVTVHLVEGGYDEGTILARRKVSVHKTDTAATLAERVLRVEHQIYPETLQKIIIIVKNMQKAHLKIFVQHLAGATAEEQWVGSNIKDWWSYVKTKLTHQCPEINLPNDKMTRTQLKKLCHADSGASDLECAVAVMAWGKQKTNHGTTLFNRFAEIQPIIRDMRSGNITHLEAYKRFDGIWQKPEPLGMGAAYFTKLIFFCEPSHKGYIMDQWTSKSVNLLTCKDVVYLTAGHVNKKNTVENYQRFCKYIEKLASKLGTSGENVEIAMFSKGGRRKWPWRQYMVNQTKKQKDAV